jgi:CRISPR-associated protein Csy2
MIEDLDGLILLPHLRVQNANAISGPLTWGFPPPSAFAGWVHALHRDLADPEIVLDGVGIVCHAFEPQTYRPSGRYHNRFCLTRNPVGKDGKPMGTVEEGRAHLEVSLVIGVQGDLDQEEGEDLADKVLQRALTKRLAGGSLLEPGIHKRLKPDYLELSGYLEGDQELFRKFRRRLMPGFALMNRHRILEEHLQEIRQQNPQASSLDAFLELVRLNVDPVLEDPQDPEKVTWQASRTKPGWLVPLPVGYGAISPLYAPGEVQNTRDSETLFRFVECLYSLGEWVSPHRLEYPQEMLWHHQADPNAGVYLLTQPEIN